MRAFVSYRYVSYTSLGPSENDITREGEGGPRWTWLTVTRREGGGHFDCDVHCNKIGKHYYSLLYFPYIWAIPYSVLICPLDIPIWNICLKCMSFKLSFCHQSYVYGLIVQTFQYYIQPKNRGFFSTKVSFTIRSQLIHLFSQLTDIVTNTQHIFEIFRCQSGNFWTFWRIWRT